MIRWQFTRSGRFKVPVRVEIHDDEYSGSPQELDLVGSDPVKKTGGQRNSNALRRILGEYLEIRLRGKTGDFEDFFTRDNERFRVKHFVDGNFDSEYIPITDTHREPDTKGTFEITLRCAGVSMLKQVRAWEVFDVDEDSHERMSKLDGIYKLLNHYFDYTVTDGTNLYPVTANTNTSALSQVFFNTARFDEEQTAYEALEWLVGEKNQVRIQDGTAYVFCPLDAEFTGYSYNGSSIGSGQTFDSNFVAEKIGGRLSTTRSNQQAYDGVRRIYRPGEAPNIVPGGNMADLDDFIITPSAPFTPRIGFPRGWNLIQSGLFDATRVVATNDHRNPLAWRLRTGFVRLAATNQYAPSIFQADTGTRIQQGKRLRVGLSYLFDVGGSNPWGVPFEVRVGDYVLIQRVIGTRANNTLDELEWVPRNTVLFPQNFLFPSALPNITEDFSVISPPIPEAGEISFLVASPMPAQAYVTQILGGFGSNPITGVDSQDNVQVSQISCDVTDEEGEIVIESKELAGEDGDVYEFVDYFGDGFTSVTPGALELANGNPTTLWKIPGLTGEFTLAEIKTKFILSEFSRDRKRLQGTVDTFDAIALINDFRVNYYSTSYVWGRYNVELCEISEHDLEATTEERRERGTGSFTGRPSIDRPPLNFFGNLLRIGELNEDVDEERTEIDVIVDEPIRAGYEYWIINESELDPRDKEAGVYPFVPRFLDDQGDPIVVSDPLDLPEDTQFEFGPGDIDIKIEEVLITAPLGSIIVEAPGQREIERNVTAEVIIETVERVTITEDEIDAQATLILGVQASIEDIEDDVSANASSILTLDSRVTVNEDDITAQASAILAIESDITDLENETSANASAILALDTRVEQNEDDISAQASAILGIETRLEDGSFEFTASAFLQLDSEVTVIDGELDNITAKAALVVDAGGTIGSINLAADGLTGFSEIDIQASQVKINQVIFDDEGAMYSDNFNGGIDDGLIQGVGTIGWALDRSGYGVFNDIDVRDSDFTDCNFGGSSSIIEDSSLVDINLLSGDIQVGPTDVRFAAMTQATSPSGVNPLRLMANTAQSITGGGNTAYAVYWVRPN